MGRVFLARTEGPAGFSKQVVLKTLHRHLADDLSFLEFFLAEARLSALLHHANVAQVFELVHEDGEYFLAMEYVRGRSLREVLARSGRLPSALAVSVISQVARALHHAHTAADDSGKLLHIVHRDVSPENVLTSWDGAVKLVDFGLAGARSRRAGKRNYLAPEVLEGAVATASSDIFAAATVLVELLTGVLPTQPLALPGDAEALRGVLERALAPASDRYLLASEFADGLDAAARASGLSASAGELAVFLANTYGAIPDDDLASEAPNGTTALLTEMGKAEPMGAPRRDGRRALIVGGAFVVLVAAWIARGSASWLLDSVPAAPAPTATVTPKVLAPASPDPVALPPPAPAPAPTTEEPHRRVETKAAPRPGWIDARISPWADIFVDGRKVGTTPMKPFELSAGPHTIELRNGELEVKTTRQVRVRSGETQTLRVDLLDLISGP